MKLVTMQARSRVTDDAMHAMSGGRLLPEHVPMVTSVGDVDVYMPNGLPLIMVRRGVCADLSQAALPILDKLARTYGSDNRGKYAGLDRAARRKPDGSLAKKSRTHDGSGKLVVVPSAVAGYFERQGGMHPYCRQTAFLAKEAAKWEALQPLIRRVAEVYEYTATSRFHKQQAAAQEIRPEWVINGTPFTTITVNSNVLGSIHTDKGDFKEGMGCITVHRAGQYRGAVLGFPQYGVGVDLQDGDAVLFNPHEWHGVTAMTDKSEDALRVSVVYYMRAKMVECGSPDEELARGRSMFDRRNT